jgi:uncharacterized protein (TIGR02597 family)
MKSPTLNVFCCAAGMILAASGVGLSQIATTEPVGFITLNVAGTGGTSGAAISFKGLGLTRLVEYQGIAESVTANTLVDNDASWTENQYNGAAGTYYVEIISGPGVGTTYDINTTTAATKKLTLGQNLAPGITAPVSFKIRKHWTIASVFGANNESGFQGGSDVNAADQILIYNGTGYDVYFYQQSAFGTGWRNAANAAVDAGPIRIYPEDGVIVKRRQAAAVNVVLMGAVKTGQTSVPITPGTNIVSNVYAAPMTLLSSGLYTGNNSTGVVGGADPNSSDQVLIYNGTGYDIYYYQLSAFGNGWRSAANAGQDASATQIPVGSSFVLKRVGATGFDWKAPQHPGSL